MVDVANGGDRGGRVGGTATTGGGNAGAAPVGAFGDTADDGVAVTVDAVDIFAGGIVEEFCDVAVAASGVFDVVGGDDGVSIENSANEPSVLLDDAAAVAAA
jgi:hypothetical protein